MKSISFILALTAVGALSARAQNAINNDHTRPAFCPEVEKPVCATKDGKRLRYGNECQARRAGAAEIKPASGQPSVLNGGADPCGQT